MSPTQVGGGPSGPDPRPASARPLSALPSVRARALAFAAILVAGLCGGLIGYGFVGLQCHGACTTPDGLGGLTGAVIAAGGVAVVAVLTLRAMGEWRTITEDRALAEAAAAARAGTGGSGPGPAGGTSDESGGTGDGPAGGPGGTGPAGGTDPDGGADPAPGVDPGSPADP